VTHTSSYEIGAFEALEWVWHLLRNEKEQPGSIEDAYKRVQDTLASIGSGSGVNFKQKITELKLNH
jgi:hypothetical protein